MHPPHHVPTVRAPCTALALLLAMIAQPSRASADEGMWLPNAFPSDRVKARYGFGPDQAWLDRVRLSSVRLAQGCSGSFVSPDGLVVTNHHCAHACIQQLSTVKHDLVADGFYAATAAAERRCPELEVDQLVSIDDVTASMNAALANKSGSEFSAAKRSEQARLSKACAIGDEVRCDVVELYHGARYQLYRYRRYQDVRLVFAPELAIAFFGGDPDNFNFPRYDLDVSFLRVYDRGKPLATEHYFPFSAQGAQPGELTFTSGHPGSTSRELTVPELLFERRVRLPRRLIALAELHGLLTEFARRGKEQRRYSGMTLFDVDNALKAYTGMFHALLDDTLIDQKRAAERVLRARMAKQAQPQASGAFADIERAVKTKQALFDPYDLLERGRAFDGSLFEFARSLVRAADELTKPNDQRLPEYTDASLPQLKQALLSPAPVHKDLEQLELTFSLGKLREILGASDPRVRAILGQQSPQMLAAALVKDTKLDQLAVRKRLFDGGKAAVDACRDPMIAFARQVDAESRAVRKRYEDEVDSVLNRAHEAIAAVRFAMYGDSEYPDATFSLRISYGTVQGWQEHGQQVPPLTHLKGAFERQTGQPPFALPASWLKARDRLNLDTPFNFVTTNDIVGGNSGSPVIDRRAEIIGLIFDGNLPSLGGEYGFDARVNRAVAVDARAIVEALRVIYGAERIADELAPPHQQAK